MSSWDTTYQPQAYEAEILKLWESTKAFKVDPRSPKKPYTILMPPPNITSQLHMGHGASYTLMDILIRLKRMQGFEAHWIAGTDHAGIATQMMVEKSLKQEGLTKESLGREAFEARLVAWRQKYGTTIFEQMKKLGFSADWSQAAYTLDDSRSKSVREVFVRLYQEGLIYRGQRLINWDPELLTAVSDDEIEHIDVNGKLYYIAYKVVGTAEEIIVATTRPETMFGDVALALNPEDERFKALHGKTVKIPLTDREIPLVLDSYVDPEFGTGALKITPAHDYNDFELAKRHKLPMVTVLNERAELSGSIVPAPLRGLGGDEKRKAVVKALKDQGHLKDEKPHRHSVPHSERSKAVIEPRLSLQWFLKMESLAAPAAQVAREGQIKFIPENTIKTYLHWLDHCRDWCISRQLWWGHRIPIWYCKECQHVNTGIEDPESCEACASKELDQDPDVLDTWFSSWLWPLSSLGWPAQDEDTQSRIAAFFPSEILISGAEILYLWITRMVMFSLKFGAKLPFKSVYIAATVCDLKGRKFSKTLGNGIDPVEVIEKHGADAVRLSSTILAPLGGRLKMDYSAFDLGSRFVNKLWNAARFLSQTWQSGGKLISLEAAELAIYEKWLIHSFDKKVAQVTQLFDSYRINEAIEQLYHFFWGEFCDWGIECSKERLQDSKLEAGASASSALTYVLEGIIRLLSPVCPFICEKIFQSMPTHPNWPRENVLACSAYPKAQANAPFETEALQWEKVKELIGALRSVKQQSNLSAQLKLPAIIKVNSPELLAVKDLAKPFVIKLAHLSELEWDEQSTRPAKAITAIGKGFEAYLPVEGHLDLGLEIKRLGDEQARLEKVKAAHLAKLLNEKFLAQAPSEIVAETKAKAEDLDRQIDSINRNLESLR